MVDVKEKDDRTVRTEWKEGVKYTWDRKGMCFVSIHVGNAPLSNWEEWNSECHYSSPPFSSLFFFNDSFLTFLTS